MKKKTELKAWRVRIGSYRFCAVVSDPDHPGFYWHYEDDREIVWRRWSRLWESRLLHSESDEALAAIAAIEAYKGRLQKEEDGEEAISQWQRQNPGEYQAMLSFVVALGQGELPEDQTVIDMLLGCQLRIYDRRVGLSSKEREQYRFAIGVYGPVDLVRRRLEFAVKLAKADDSLASLREKLSVNDDSITWSMFVRMELTLRKRKGK